MHPEKMLSAADEASNLLKALAGRTRLMILCRLTDGEMPVGALASELGLRATAVSQQLALLRKDGLVRTRREGQTIHYSLAGSEARQVIEVLYKIFCAPKAAEAD